MEATSEIKDRLSVDEVVSEYVQLKPAGSNYKGLCPFHHEKTPSFMVSPEKGIYHCFGCGEGGDIFSFVEKLEGLTFREALEKLAQKAGVDLPEQQGDSQATRGHKERLFNALKTAAQYYHIQLGRSEVVKDYLLKQRQFTSETIKQFQLGYAPSEGQRLVQFLRKQGFNDRELLDSGLARKRGNELQDLFRNRVMVPFIDSQGRVIGFTGRILGDGMPKYLNTPQTKLFDKSRFVFGLYQARESIRSAKEVIVVEGNLDVISSAQAGIGQVVAVSGTAVTLPQLKQLARLTQHVTFAFDADSAGVKASVRAIPLAQEAGVNLSVVTLPEGQDPDDVIKENVEVWRRLLKDKHYVIDWLVERYKQEYDLATVEGKREFTNQMSDSLRRLKDPVEQEHYVQQLADLVGVAPATIMKKLSSEPAALKSPIKKAKNQPGPPPKHDEVKTVISALLGMAVTYPDVRGALEDVSAELLDEESAALLNYLKSKENQEIELSDQQLPKELLGVENYVKILLLRGEEQYGSWSLLDRQVEAFSLAHRLQEFETKRHKQRLSQEIAAAEAAGDNDLRQKLLKQYQALNK